MQNNAGSQITVGGLGGAFLAPAANMKLDSVYEVRTVFNLSGFLSRIREEMFL